MGQNQHSLQMSCMNTGDKTACIKVNMMGSKPC